jgi:DNA-directed RNA polymerase specialized sigma24 family protein
VEKVLTQSGLDQLLAALDADRERAGAKYESLRVRLIKFFEWRNCETPDELTDTVIDQLIKKISEGEQIQNINAYAATVAGFVFKSDCRRRERLFQPIDDNPAVEKLAAADTFAAADEDDNSRFDCLDKCLAQFSDENRRLVVAYFDTDERTMIATRKRLADSLDVSLNSLRIRVCRLKAKLEDCTKNCCRKIKNLK